MHLTWNTVLSKSSDDDQIKRTTMSQNTGKNQGNYICLRDTFKKSAKIRGFVLKVFCLKRNLIFCAFNLGHFREERGGQKLKSQIFWSILLSKFLQKVVHLLNFPNIINTDLIFWFLKFYVQNGGRRVGGQPI